MVELHSDRLRLLALDLRHLRLLRQSRAVMEEALGLNPIEFQTDREMEIEIRQAVDFWLINVESRPEDYAWYTNWEVILQTENRSIGGIGLSGRPDAQGKVMTGYFIDNRYQNQGYATEGLRTIIEWAFRDPDLRCLTAETSNDHLASHRVLIKNHFQRVQEADQIWVWERSVRPATSAQKTLSGDMGN
jgi:[ribosomal protein S5]-alanine N-acetyltransferase